MGVIVFTSISKLDFSIKGYVISEKQFKLEKKQEVMPFCLTDGPYFNNVL